MPRTLSPTLTTVKNTNQAHTTLLLDLTAGAQQHHFASKSLTFAGNAYVPRLAFDGSITHRRSLELDTATVQVENASLFFTELLKTLTLEGATASLRRLFLEADETVTIFDGIVSSCRIERGAAELRLTSRLDPSATRIPQRFYNGPEFEALTRELEQTVPPVPANAHFENEQHPFWEDYAI